jgi:hypothetical protein
MYRATASASGIRTTLGLLALVAVTCSVTSGFADEAEDSAEPMVTWPTPEGRAFEAARQKAGVAYIDCLIAIYRANDTTPPADARVRCASEAEAYRTFLPADEADSILDVVAAQVHNEHRSE